VAVPLKILPASLRLKRVFHYHQRAGVHPQPVRIPPYHECVELVTGGRGWVEDRGKWIEVTSGHLIWHKPGNHTIARSDFANPYRCLAIQFRTHKKEGLGVKRLSLCPEPEAISAFAAEAVKLFVNRAIHRTILCQYLVGRLLLWAHQHSLEIGRAGLPPGIQKALTWIEARYAHPCPVEEIAQQAGWSSAHLHHLFRRSLGITPHQVLRQRRLRAAREQLVSTSHPVKRIAVECGFTSASAFIHAFRAELNTTPKAYRLRQAAMRSSPQAISPISR
jgi:AraC-like DNA-binding protein